MWAKDEWTGNKSGVSRRERNGDRGECTSESPSRISPLFDQ
ncbi:hypothetical protein RSSM_02750 [Rhodopirellula sallentina SM41]|uniref:Uncharacterized protein n=1 Tax=Rhodopirellula sallentina SM41 TaxID=1263870 RepID=M5U3H1_9BACT|nr:hypothetical protein RSSM_02750 [Rhodopirellula sallentina SM41]